MKQNFVKMELQPMRILYGILSVITLCCVKTVNCGLESSGSSLNLPCKAYRVEIAFPTIDDATGKVTSHIFSQSAPRNFLRLKLKWRRRLMDIILYKNEVAGKYSISEWEDGNTTYARAIDKTCFFHGYIRGHAKSYAALSTCDGLSGYLQTDREMLFVQPREAVVTGGTTYRAHIVYTCEQPSVQERTDARHKRSPRYMPVQPRGRRSALLSATKYLEVQVVIDHTMVDFIGSKEKTEKYVMDLMNIANTVFQHRTLDADIKVIVVKIIFLTRNQQRYVLRRKDAFRTVNMFCQWSVDNIPRGQSMNYDISVLITKDELGPSGYAPITGLCNPIRSCAAVHDLGFTTGFVIAHEMAHVFGLFHDGHGNNCYGNKFRTSIMAAVVESKLNHFWWSECSKRRMQDVIRFLYCLNNKPKAIEDHYPLSAPQRIQSDLGKAWPLDFQCSMEFGEHFQLCHAFYNDPCSTLWCSRKNNPHYCRTKRGPPMPGSVCGRDKECHNDRCQYVGDRDPVDGAWTQWSEWSDCSNGCGVGVRQRSRSCDNPAPMFNGLDCEGEQHIWDTCYNNTCTSFQDNREGECAVWDSVQVRTGTHSWMPAEPVNATTRCKQTCQSSYTKEVVTIEVDVSDGTPCSYLEDTSDVCMSGRCLSVGCDGKLNSTKKRDACGVCGGDGSGCKTVRGLFNIKPKSGTKYLTVAILPPGARNVTILQLNKAFEKIALKDELYGNFLLNGDKTQSKHGVMIKRGFLVNYTRNAVTKMDIVTIPGPLMTKVAVMALPDYRLQNITMSYKYTVHQNDYTLEKNTYRWKFMKWSPCSVTCGSGIQFIVHGCQDKFTDQMVDNEKCAFLDQPRQDNVTCTRGKCSRERFNYAMTNKFSECDAKCSQTGTQTQQVICERYHNNRYQKVDIHFCDHLNTPIVKKSCRGEPCQNEEQITYEWSASVEWSSCQSMKECGGPGHRTRPVQCVAIRGLRTSSNETVDDTKCQAGEGLKPQSAQTCQAEPCPDRFQWKMEGSWSQCPCGSKNGTQSRSVVCERLQEDENGEVTVTSTWTQDCQNVTDMPDSNRTCDGGPCPPSFQWLSDRAPGQCDASCGEAGVRRLALSCQQVVEWEGEDILEIVADSFCDNDTKPNGTPCQAPPCKPVYRWTPTDQWTECNAECDETAQQYRVFICERSLKNSTFTKVDDGLCGQVTRENETKTCKGPQCDLRWQKGYWSDCTVTCGRGKRYRKVYCGDPETDMDDARCTDTPPKTSRRCDLPLCPAPKRDECRNVFSFCTSYPSLNIRCKRASFQRKCCETCLQYQQEDYIKPPQNALEEYMKKQGLGRWRKKTRK